ncbi:hypothetical protein [Streptomyces sp. UNOC14_S4]|uniref:hypothetical protein n=1 Tax=Streptomyces sp. UNOC14_S4 TaxID=2872340 RepID=UPI001E54CCE4|nr:hypothetical protein [Streptomyces sp. UNOC14_S4]MCC3767290.1 hypothetical protein [Streptomyces sp. UNOC14_S4]
MFDVVAEVYSTGARSSLVELGALADDDARRIAEATPNTHAVDRFAHETIGLIEQTHRGILRGAEDGYRQVVARSPVRRCSASTRAARPFRPLWRGSPTAV